MNIRVFFMFVLLSVSVLSQVDAVVVNIPDPNLETVIRSALVKPTGDLTDEDLAKLTKLEAVNKAMVDLSGLEYCINLTELNLHSNRISDIRPLENLTGLKWLSLEDNLVSNIDALGKITEMDYLSVKSNYVTDISALTTLSNLRTLDLTNNQIQDVKPLASLINLRELYLGGNQIADVSPLAQLVNLRTLHLWKNLINDLTPIGNLSNLENLSVADNQCSDVSPLGILYNLTMLDIPGNNVEDISALSNLTNLDILRVGGNMIKDATPLSGLTNLRVADFWGNDSLSDLTPLANLTNLTSLHLFYNRSVEDISPLSSLTNLRYLSLGGTQVSDINPLAGLTNLIELNLESCKISDITPLANLVNLEQLFLFGNSISDINPLSGLSNLWKLMIGGNLFSDISPLANLTSLEYLDLSHGGGDPANQITDIGPLAGLINLNFLNASNGKITDLQPLLNNPGFAAEDSLDVRGNPLRDLALCVQIPALQLRGVNVLFDPGAPSPTIGVTQMEPQATGSPFWIDIYAGTEAAPVSGLFGISFKLNYTNTGILDVVSPTSESVAVGELLGSDVLSFSNVDDGKGQVMISITRKAGAGGIDGFGTLARVRMIADSTATADTNVEFAITDIQAQDPDGNRIYCIIPKSATITIKQGSVIVWPGDTDNNGVVDERDVLPIGMFWAKTGPARIPAVVTWDGYSAEAWTPSMATYADANGDGIVDERDVLPIGMNWHKTHEVPEGAPSIDIASVDHARYIDSYRALLASLETSPETEPVVKIRGLLRDIIEHSIPENTMAFQNYPNPFNPETWIPYQLRESSEVTIRIYSVKGELVRELRLGTKTAGSYISQDKAAHWDGRNKSGQQVSSGVYFYHFEAGQLSTVRKMTVTR